MDFPFREKGQQLCFEVENAAEIDSRDPWACINLERALPEIGVFATRINVRDRLFCVFNKYPHDNSVDNILAIFTRFGFTARLKREAHDHES
jgi:hypothetical protein